MLQLAGLGLPTQMGTSSLSSLHRGYLQREAVTRGPSAAVCCFHPPSLTSQCRLTWNIVSHPQQRQWLSADPRGLMKNNKEKRKKKSLQNQQQQQNHKLDSSKYSTLLRMQGQDRAKIADDYQKTLRQEMLELTKSLSKNIKKVPHSRSKSNVIEAQLSTLQETKARLEGALQDDESSDEENDQTSKQQVNKGKTVSQDLSVQDTDRLNQLNAALLEVRRDMLRKQRAYDETIQQHESLLTKQKQIIQHLQQQLQSQSLVVAQRLTQEQEQRQRVEAIRLNLARQLHIEREQQQCSIM